MTNSSKSFDSVGFMREARQTLAKEWHGLTFEDLRRRLDSRVSIDPRLQRFLRLGRTPEGSAVASRTSKTR